ncbi:hypothetical protein COV24_02915 [candidate division WWE3 bacterium CG10_big_fil_rev_8_21_14_0_10_32_10]|uniref:SHSP domain-containing protein n=1 Tax=candidate division WWE3 bacterium CG10_big_fil_rev_8_21_14_0_10_32_10 TaxID=1975090 RepID=A0A2H0RA13_UNCKA|nr:MAG: hypothetical protein COV24_02915 [candidate division WWE3 bacterium CG10_big_fil_rev_8_21_14_0_10_32_10]
MQTSFDYYYSLPARVNSSKANAKVKQGVVTVVMPKEEEDKGKSIKVTEG